MLALASEWLLVYWFLFPCGNNLALPLCDPPPPYPHAYHRPTMHLSVGEIQSPSVCVCVKRFGQNGAMFSLCLCIELSHEPTAQKTFLLNPYKMCVSDGSLYPSLFRFLSLSLTLSVSLFLSLGIRLWTEKVTCDQRYVKLHPSHPQST